MIAVEHWTGAEVRCLRHARRMSVRDFARHLGVSHRMVSKWEAGGANIRPRPVNQAALDQSLLKCTPLERNRFDGALHGLPEDSRPPRSPIRWSLIIDLPPSDPDLTATIAAAVRSAVLGHDDSRETGLHR
jgi:transcriptional regulator with XRE-family HTH domain